MLSLPTIVIAAALTFQHALGDTFVSMNVLPRQLGGVTIPTNIDTECVTTCSGFSNGVLECTTNTITCMCSSSLATSLRDCLQCLVGHGMTAADASTSLGGFTEGCEALGYPVTIAPIDGGTATNSVSASRLSSAPISRPATSTTSLPSPSSTTKSNTDVSDGNQSGSSDSPFGTNNNSDKNGSESNGAFSPQRLTVPAVLGLVVTLIHYL